MRPNLIFLALLGSCVCALGQTPAGDLIKQVQFEGAPALLLENDKIELTMLATGGNFVNLILKDDASRLSPLWNPAAIARAAGRRSRGAGGGHFVCVDGFGGVSPEERAAGMPGHGEAHRQPWTVQSSDKTGGVLSVVFSTHLPLVQEDFRRTIRIVDGESVIYVESELANLLGFDRPVNWAEHATIGSPFLAPGETVVDLSARQSKTRAHNDEEDPYPHRLADFKDFTWPLAPGQDGEMVDLRTTPLKPNSLDHTTSLMDTGRELVFVTALNLKQRLLLGYVFRREEYPWLQIWESYPPNMGLARGLEFGTQPFDIPRRQVIERGPMFGAPVVRWLPAKSKIGSRFLFFYTKVPAGFQKVDDVVLKDGKLVIEDRAAGQTLSLAASLALK
jgi:hypothetical protein